MTSVEIEQGLSTAQIARAVDVPIDTVRYYERVGLLPEPPRTTGAHRYPPAMVDRLQFIRGAQRLGLRLAEIRDLLAVRDTGVPHRGEEVTHRWPAARAARSKAVTAAVTAPVAAESQG